MIELLKNLETIDISISSSHRNMFNFDCIEEGFESIDDIICYIAKNENIKFKEFSSTIRSNGYYPQLTLAVNIINSKKCNIYHYNLKFKNISDTLKLGKFISDNTEKINEHLLMNINKQNRCLTIDKLLEI